MQADAAAASAGDKAKASKNLGAAHRLLAEAAAERADALALEREQLIAALARAQPTSAHAQQVRALREAVQAERDAATRALLASPRHCAAASLFGRLCAAGALSAGGATNDEW